MGGQAAHFVRYAPEPIPYAIERYTRELERLFQVLERRLGEAQYLAGSEYSIADIAVFAVRAAGGTASIPAERYPHTRRWAEAIAPRPAVQRGVAAELAIPAKYMQRKATLSEAEWSNMFGERMHGAVLA
jgi:GST-like protein